MRPEGSGPYSMPLPGSSCIEAEVREDVCRPRKTFVAVVVSEDPRQDVIVTPCADPNEEMCYACPVQCARARYCTCGYLLRGCAHVCHHARGYFITGSGVRGADPDLCHELKERIGYNY